MHRMLHAAAIASMLSLATSPFVLVGVFVGATATAVSAAYDAFLKIDGIKGESQAVVTKHVTNGKTDYFLTFNGEPAAPGTYPCANGQHIKVVGPNGMIEILSFSWGVSSLKSFDPAPTSGAATCASGFTATPTSWDSKNARDYVCKSSTPTCANGTALKLNDATTKGGYLRYTCGVPTPTTSGNPATTKTGVDNWNVLGQ
jgi:hypothetical protein